MTIIRSFKSGKFFREDPKFFSDVLHRVQPRIFFRLDFAVAVEAAVQQLRLVLKTRVDYVMAALEREEISK